MDNKRLTELKELVGGRVKAVLEQKEWTQAELAERLKKHTPFVSDLMHGKVNLTLKTIAEIEKVLGEKILK